MIETVRAHGTDGTLFGWWRPGGGVDGAFLYTDPSPMLLSAMPSHAARELADVLPVAALTVNGGPDTVRAFAGAWERRTGTAGAIRMRQCLYRLTRLDPPHPPPPGTARVAGATDRDLLLTWFEAFERESGTATGIAALVEDKLDHGGVTLWEVGGRPVSVAAGSRMVAGMTRIGYIYTPPERRRRGYGAAVTAALTRSVLDSGARHVVLFTDLANPTSNAIYRRLGYRAVSDRLVVEFGPSSPTASA